jgi:hypothetical protein
MAVSMDRPMLCLLGALALLGGTLAVSPPRPRDGGPAPLAPLAISARPVVDDGAVLAVRAVAAPKLQPQGALPDPDGVGPCPAAYAHLPVARRGLDPEGRPTWWHTDGSITTRIEQRLRRGGRTFSVPAILRMMPQGRLAAEAPR